MDAVSVLVVAEDARSRGDLVALLGGEAGALVTGGLSPSDLVNSVPADVYAWEFAGEAEQATRLFRAHSGSRTPAVAIVTRAGLVQPAIAAGARGVVSKDSLVDGAGAARLVAALRACAMGFVVREPPEAQLSSGLHSTPALTARESQVVALLAEGHPNKIIADKLHISEHTAKFHVNALIHKLHAQSRTDVVARAIRSGLLTV